MKIATIKHKHNKESSEAYLDKVSSAMPYSNIVLGPEYSLIDLKENFIKNHFSSLSKRYPNTLIVPGTFLKDYDGSSVSMVAPIFYRGELIDYIFKKSDVGDSKIAKSLTGKELHTANMDELDKTFKINGKSIRVYICADQGRYDLETPDIELVTSYDLANGIHVHPMKSQDKRNIIITDSQVGQTSGFKYNPNKEKALENLVKKEFDDFDMYKSC